MRFASYVHKPVQTARMRISLAACKTYKSTRRRSPQVLQERIEKEFGVAVDFGPPQISYRESVLDAASETVTLDRVVAGVRHLVTVTVSVRPSDDATTTQKHIKVVPAKDSEMTEANLRRRHLQAVNSGLKSGFDRGTV